MYISSRSFSCFARWLVVVAGALLGSSVSIAEAPAPPDHKPFLYTMTMNYTIPRDKWAAMGKHQASVDKLLDRALRSGRITGYGEGQYIFHSQGDTAGDTHRVYFSGKTAGDVLGVYEEMMDSGLETDPAVSSATSYINRLYYSWRYNWKPSAIKNGYQFEAIFDFKDFRGLEMSARELTGMAEDFMASGGIQGYQFSIECGMHTIDNENRVILQWVAKDRNYFDQFVALAYKHLYTTPDPVLSAAMSEVHDPNGHHRDYLSRGNFAYSNSPE